MTPGKLGGKPWSQVPSRISPGAFLFFFARSGSPFSLFSFLRSSICIEFRQLTLSCVWLIPPLKIVEFLCKMAWRVATISTPVEDGEIGRVRGDHHGYAWHEADDALHGRFRFRQKYEIPRRERANVSPHYSVDVRQFSGGKGNSSVSAEKLGCKRV